MLVRRKDHACALVKVDEERGVLVSGGVDGEDNLLDSVEFYNLETQEWQELSPLKKARTEHGKYLPILNANKSTLEFLVKVICHIVLFP